MDSLIKQGEKAETAASFTKDSVFRNLDFCRESTEDDSRIKVIYLSGPIQVTMESFTVEHKGLLKAARANTGIPGREVKILTRESALVLIAYFNSELERLKAKMKELKNLE